MSVSYDIGFTKRPALSHIDRFMQSLGFVIDDAERVGRFSRVYLFNGKEATREIELFYNNRAGNILFMGEINIKAYGSLKTFSSSELIMDPKERLRIIKDNKITTEHDYCRHLNKGRLKFYETALAIRDEFNAVVVSEQTGKPIDPNRNPFEWANKIKTK